MAKLESHPQRLGGILKTILERLPMRERLREYAVWPHWQDAVGTTIAQHARPVRIKRGVLCIAVDSPVWMQELQFLKDSIRTQLNMRAGAEVVTDLFFVLEGARANPSR
jgi:predicted nucleic acid-binding Zn ribbon protein